MKDIIVLGIGNRLMMDDGIGVYIVEALKEKNVNPNIRYNLGETDIYFCLNQINEKAYIIIIDAAYLNKEPGTISTISLDEILKNPIRAISDHDSHLLNEIRISGRSIEGMFIAIEPYKIDYCLNMSTQFQDQFDKLVKSIENIIVSLV